MREALGAFVDIDQGLGILEWEIPQNDGVDQAEHGRVGADPQTKRKDRDQREGRRPQETSDRITDVQDDLIHDPLVSALTRPAPPVASFVFDEVAQRDP